MYYHAIIRFPTENQFWTNQEYDELLRQSVIPFINKQITLVSRNDGRFVMNFGLANFLSVFRTKYALSEDFKDVWDGDKWTENEFRDNDYTQQIVEEALTSKWIKTKSPIERRLLPNKPQVFIIMKFGDRVLDSAYEGVIKPTIRRFKYLPLRIDEIQDGRSISAQILDEIANSEIVLADLTGERPNCYYEAGFAHAMDKEMIFTIRKGSVKHFDIAGYRFIEWETEQELKMELSKRFKAIKQRATQTTADGTDLDIPITSHGPKR